jgi:hypothetical protein
MAGIYDGAIGESSIFIIQMPNDLINKLPVYS